MAAVRRRSVRATAAAIVLIIEALLLFFFTLMAFGLQLVPRELAFPLGLGGVVLLIVTAGLVRYPVGYALGWILQLGLILLGLLHPLMYVIGGLSAGLWVYAVISGTRIDARNSDELRED